MKIRIIILLLIAFIISVLLFFYSSYVKTTLVNFGYLGLILSSFITVFIPINPVRPLVIAIILLPLEFNIFFMSFTVSVSTNLAMIMVYLGLVKLETPPKTSNKIQSWVDKKGKYWLFVIGSLIAAFSGPVAFYSGQRKYPLFPLIVIHLFVSYLAYLVPLIGGDLGMSQLQKLLN